MSGLVRLSVLMSVYNGGPYLAAAIDSVLSAGVPGIELVVVDNVSTDGSREWLRQRAAAEPRLCLIENETNLGQTGALQRGLEACRGALVARLDADDLSEPGRFQAQMSALEADPALALVGGQAWFIDSHDTVSGKSRLPVGAQDIAVVMTVANPFIHSAVMFRRDAALAVGGYDRGFAIAQDYALWSALLRAGHRLDNLAQPVCRLRQHPGQVTASGLRQREAPEALRITALNQAWALGRGDVDLELAATIQALWMGGEVPTHAGRTMTAFLKGRGLSPGQRARLYCLLAAGHAKGVAGLKVRLLLQGIAIAPSVLLSSYPYKAIVRGLRA